MIKKIFIFLFLIFSINLFATDIYIGDGFVPTTEHYTASWTCNKPYVNEGSTYKIVWDNRGLSFSYGSDPYNEWINPTGNGNYTVMCGWICYVLIVGWNESSQTYTFTVNGGITSGTFTSGTNCPISPTIPQGKVFMNWTSTGCTLNSASSVAINSITMPSQNCSVIANFSDPPVGHVLIVINGSGSGTYSAGTSVPIAYTGNKTFVSWDLFDRIAGNNGTLSSTTLTMPEYNYTITAIDSSGSGGASHVIVDNFGELTGIITNPIIDSINSMKGAVTDGLTSLGTSIIEAIEANTTELLEGIASVGASLNETILGIGLKVDSTNQKLDTSNEKLDSVNENLQTLDSDMVLHLAEIDADMLQGFSDVNVNLGDIKDKIDETNNNLGAINDNISNIIDILNKPTSDVNSSSGMVPSSELNSTLYNTPNDAFSLTKLDAVKNKFHSKFDPYLNVSLTSPNNSIFIIPLSHVPYVQIRDIDVQIFNNPTFMPFIAIIREILLCCVYISTIFGIIKIVRTWEHK